MLFKYLYQSETSSGMKSLENDFYRYVSKDREKPEKHKIWIVDTILNAYYKKRISGESLVASNFIENFE